MTQVNRTPITQITRIPYCKYQSKFQTCELCYGHKNCCKSYYTSGNDHTILIVNKTFEKFQELEESIKEIRLQGKLVRLIVEKNIPDSLLWAVSYDPRNLLQINVDMRNPLDQLIWTTNLAHASERCGIFFVYMVYPIIPNYIQTYHVLSVIDTIRSIPHCVVMLKFAVFKNTGRLSSKEYINVNRRILSKKYVCELKPGEWGCTEDFKQYFYHKIESYCKFQYLNVEVCGGI